MSTTAPCTIGGGRPCARATGTDRIRSPPPPEQGHRTCATAGSPRPSTVPRHGRACAGRPHPRQLSRAACAGILARKGVRERKAARQRVSLERPDKALSVPVRPPRMMPGRAIIGIPFESWRGGGAGVPGPRETWCRDRQGSASGCCLSRGHPARGQKTSRNISSPIALDPSMGALFVSRYFDTVLRSAPVHVAARNNSIEIIAEQGRKHGGTADQFAFLSG